MEKTKLKCWKKISKAPYSNWNLKPNIYLNKKSKEEISLVNEVENLRGSGRYSPGIFVTRIKNKRKEFKDENIAEKRFFGYMKKHDKC